jgi:hypothetical protein
MNWAKEGHSSPVFVPCTGYHMRPGRMVLRVTELVAVGCQALPPLKHPSFWLGRSRWVSSSVPFPRPSSSKICNCY